MGGGGGGRGCTKAIGTVSRECYGSGTSKAWSSNDWMRVACLRLIRMSPSYEIYELIVSELVKDLFFYPR